MKIEKYTGTEGIKAVFEKTLLSESKMLFTILSGKPLVYLAGESFSQKYMDSRKEKNIFLKSLRCSQIDVDKPEHKDYTHYNKEVRTINFPLNNSFVMWDSFVAVIDVKNVEITLFQDKEFSDDIKQWFDLLWKTAQKES